MAQLTEPRGTGEMEEEAHFSLRNWADSISVIHCTLTLDTWSSSLVKHVIEIRTFIKLELLYHIILITEYYIAYIV